MAQVPLTLREIGHGVGCAVLFVLSWALVFGLVYVVAEWIERLAHP